MTWRRTRLIMWKEAIQLRRDPLLLRLIFVMPVLQLLLFGYVVGADVRNLPTAIIDVDQTELSRQLGNAFSSSGYFTIVQRPADERRPQDMAATNAQHPAHRNVVFLFFTGE